jgi:polysaccharide export outer membrane protein
MSNMVSRAVRGIALLSAVALVASCGLPRTGPTKREIFAGSVLKQGDAFIVSVNNRVTRATSVQPVFGFSKAFKQAGLVGSDTIRPGDTLSLMIYENVENGLLTSGLGGPSGIDEVQVDSGGFIFVPYAGRLRAAGNTPEQLRQVITRKLDAQTPDPQVIVRRVAGDGSSVSIVGQGVGGQGNFPIEQASRTLMTMLASAGGINSDPQQTQITVFRGAHKGTVWMSDLLDNPDLDIALRPNDRIVVKEDTRKFMTLGATGSQSLVEFISPTLSALEAIAQVGGLSANSADPTGVFVLRNEPEEIARAVLGRTDLRGTQRFVYLLDLTEPNGLFEARDFAIRDGDTVYVTEAPFTQWNKSIAALTGTLGAANTLSSALPTN